MPDPGDLNAVGSHCPRCGAEYRPGFTVCADDGTELVPGPAPRSGEPDPRPAATDPGEEPQRDWWGQEGHRRAEDYEEPVLLGEWPQQDADLLVGRLRSEGIGAFAEHAAEHPYGRRFPLSSLTRVYVERDQVEEARRIVEEVAQA